MNRREFLTGLGLILLSLPTLALENFFFINERNAIDLNLTVTQFVGDSKDFIKNIKKVPSLSYKRNGAYCVGKVPVNINITMNEKVHKELRATQVYIYSTEMISSPESFAGISENIIDGKNNVAMCSTISSPTLSRLDDGSFIYLIFTKQDNVSLIKLKISPLIVAKYYSSQNNENLKRVTTIFDRISYSFPAIDDINVINIESLGENNTVNLHISNLTYI